MRARKLSAVLVAVVVLAAAAACGTRSDDAQKLADVQKQLDDAKKELAAKAAAEQPAGQAATAEAPAASPPNAPAAPKAPAAGQPKPAKGQAKAQPAPEEVKDKEARAALEQHNAAIEKQKSLNAAQANTNTTVQRQIEELKPREFTLPVGSIVHVRTIGDLSTSKLTNGAIFEATLDQPIVVDGTMLAKSGALVRGVVVSSDPGGRVKGVASLTVGVRAITGVDGAMINVKTDSYEAVAKTSKGKDAKRTGIMTGVGAAVGAIAGGGKGAAIGAGVGAGAGVGTTVATRGEAAVIESETLMELRLTAPATVVLKK